jgi:hypothetical protein
MNRQGGVKIAFENLYNNLVVLEIFTHEITSLKNGDKLRMISVANLGREPAES